MINIFVKKKKGKRLGKTIVAHTIIPLNVDFIYIEGFEIKIIIQTNIAMQVAI